MNIGDYILINNKYIGKIIKLLWNNTNLIVKLINYSDYIDPTIKNYSNLLDDTHKEGYMLVTINKNVIKMDNKLLQNSIINYNEPFEKISTKIQINFNKYIYNIQNLIKNNGIDKSINFNNSNQI